MSVMYRRHGASRWRSLHIARQRHRGPSHQTTHNRPLDSIIRPRRVFSHGNRGMTMILAKSIMLWGARHMVPKCTRHRTASDQPPTLLAYRLLSGPAELKWRAKAKQSPTGQRLYGPVASRARPRFLRQRRLHIQQECQRPRVPTQQRPSQGDPPSALAHQPPPEDPIHHTALAAGGGQDMEDPIDGLAPADRLHPMDRQATPTIHSVAT